MTARRVKLKQSYSLSSGSSRLAFPLGSRLGSQLGDLGSRSLSARAPSWLGSRSSLGSSPSRLVSPLSSRLVSPLSNETNDDATGDGSRSRLSARDELIMTSFGQNVTSFGQKIFWRRVNNRRRVNNWRRHRPLFQNCLLKLS